MHGIPVVSKQALVVMNVKLMVAKNKFPLARAALKSLVSGAGLGC